MREHPLDVTHELEEEAEPLFCEVCSEEAEEPTYTRDWRLVCGPCYDMLAKVEGGTEDEAIGTIRAEYEPGEDEKE